MPMDQQPHTTAFREAHDAAETPGVEEVHAVKEGVTYDISFTRYPSILVLLTHSSTTKFCLLFDI